MYKCVMVISSVYGYIDKQTDGIDRHGDRHKDRHKDREIWRWREAIHSDAYLSGLSGVCRLSVHFGCLGCLEFVGSDFCPP